ncbi:MAG: nuclear transport factor 2 family protein [Hyphomonadaceae bacterium]|nr:nuclear transport factor 2 family protein [Hyphomonadaceae bacterium]
MRTFILMTTLLLAMAQPAFGGEREQAAVKARQAAYYQSYVDADIATFSDILADGFVYQHPSGATLTEDQFLDLFRSGSLKVSKAPAPAFTARDYGDTIVTYGQSAVEATVNGAPANGVIRFVNVWRKDGRAWRMVHRNSEFLP